MNYDWGETRESAIEAFAGETPGAQLEQDILVHFADDPERVIRAINRIAAQTGVNSKWAVLRADLSRTAQADVVASNVKGRARAIERAKQWTDNAGLHHDLERDVEAELFGDDYTSGRLSAYAKDDALRGELLEYWAEQRPRGEQAERDHEAWCAKAAANRAVLLERQRKEAQCSPPAQKPPHSSPESSPEPRSPLQDPSSAHSSTASTPKTSTTAEPEPAAAGNPYPW